MPKFTLWLKLFTFLYVFILITGTFKVSPSHNGGYRIQVLVTYLTSGYAFLDMTLNLEICGMKTLFVILALTVQW